MRPGCDRLAAARPAWALVLLSATTALFIWSFVTERPLLTDINHVTIMCKAVYGPRIWFITNALAGSAAVIALATALGHLPFVRKILVFIGSSTMGIYLLHKNIYPELKTLTGMTGDTFPEALILSALCFAAALAILQLIIRLALWLIGKTAGTAAATADTNVFSAALCADMLSDGKIDFDESTRLLKSLEGRTEEDDGYFARLRDALIEARADGVITPEEFERLCRLLRSRPKA